MLRGIFTITIVGSALLVQHRYARGDTKEIPDTIREAWSNYESKIPCLAGKLLIESSRWEDGKSKKQSNSIYKIKLSRSGALLELASPEQRLMSRVFGSNSQYSFSLSQKTAAADYLLEEFSQDKNHVFPRRLPAAVRDEVTKLISASYYVADFTPAVLLSSQQYQIDKITPSPDRSNAIRVVFSQASQSPSSTRAQRGWFDTNPTQGWAIIAGEYTRIDGGIPAEFRFSSTAILIDNFPVPQERTTRCTVTKKNGSRVTSETRVIYELKCTESIPEAEFTLSAFGLPEPPGINWGKPTPRYVWFLLAAGAFAVLMLGFRYLARRRRAATAAG